MLQTFGFAVPEGTLRIERTYQEINVASRVADEKWRATDSNGHEHYCNAVQDPDGERGGHYPTLVYVPGPTYYCAECRDEHEDYAVSHYECLVCGETVQPGSRDPDNPEGYVLTRQSATLNDEFITKERAEEILSACRSRAAAAKARENRARRLAKRRGLRLQRHRARDPRHALYDTYQITWPDGSVVAAKDNKVFGYQYGLTLDEAEKALNMT